VGACVGEVKKQAGQLKNKFIYSDFKPATAFLVSQRTSYLKEIKFESIKLKSLIMAQIERWRYA
jgi:hypothetical protein